jgi:hypothetical protein
VLLLIDDITPWRFLAWQRVGIERRGYWLAELPARALLVTRNGLDLAALAGKTVDALVGWEKVQPGFGHTPDTWQTKITVFAVEQESWSRGQESAETSLSILLQRAPHIADRQEGEAGSA